MIRSVLATLAVGFCTSVHAHDRWMNGEPVPEWVMNQCCSVADAHHIDPEDVVKVDGGYRIESLPDRINKMAGPLPQDDIVNKTIPENRMLPSPDGSFWVFYSSQGNYVYCFFGAIAGT